MSFNPNQPRVPAGSPDGGQFAGGASVLVASGPWKDQGGIVLSSNGKTVTVQLKMASEPKQFNAKDLKDLNSARPGMRPFTTLSKVEEQIAKSGNLDPRPSDVSHVQSAYEGYKASVSAGDAKMAAVWKRDYSEKMLGAKRNDQWDKRNRAGLNEPKAVAPKPSTNARGGVKFSQRMDSAFEFSKNKGKK